MSQLQKDANVSRQDNVVKLLLAVLFVIIGIYLYQHIEMYEETVRSDFSPQAQREPYLAAKHLLESYDTPVTLYDDYRQLSDDSLQLDSNDVVIMTEAEIALSQAISDKLLNFVRSGGHLILSVYSSQGDDGYRNNQLFRDLGVQVEIKDSDLFTAQATTEDDYTKIITSDEIDIRVNLETELRIVSPGQVDAVYWSATEFGTSFIEVEYDDGLISYLSDAYIWNNYQIDDVENVELLVDMVAGKSNVYIFSAKDLPHWFVVVYDFAPYFIWSLLLLTVLYIWYRAVRFGPIFKQDKHLHTPFVRHIDAAGHYYWRSGQKEHLVAQLRLSIIGAVIKKKPSIKAKDKTAIIEFLAKASQWQQDDIERVLYSETVSSETHFTQIVSTLQTLRKLL